MIIIMAIFALVEFLFALLLGSFIFGSIFGILFIWLILMAMSVKLFVVSVPEVTGLLTVDYFSGKLRTYSTGIHLKLPWEQVKIGNYINLRIITEQVDESYPSQDGALMLVKWSYQYKPCLERLATYISSDDHTIKDGIKDVGSSILSSEIAKTNSSECKSKQGELEKTLADRFQTMEPTPEELYGIDLIRTSLADVDFEKTVQAAKATQVVAKMVQEIATKIKLAHKEISDKDALNAAMILNGNVTKSVTEVEGEGGKALAALLIAMSQGKK